MSYPFPVPRGHFYEEVPTEVQVCDLNPGDVIKTTEGWETVLSKRPVNHTAAAYNVATHEATDDRVRLHRLPNEPDYILHVYRRIHPRLPHRRDQS